MAAGKKNADRLNAKARLKVAREMRDAELKPHRHRRPHPRRSAVNTIRVEKIDRPALEKKGVFGWPVWTKETSTFDWHYDEREQCYFLEGEVTVESKEGRVSFGKGDFVTFPKGLTCVWHVKTPVRKHYRFGE